MPVLSKSNRLKKELKLVDVFAISTGAMFSSGFFLLPGLAAAKAGPSVVLAYLFAGVLILPAMFSKAELSTALPRAGGTYYFLDRALGPLVGTIGGLGTYLALTLKTAFALIGIGAYAAFFIELPIKTVAVVLTLVFMLINIVGAKETTRLQRWLVYILLLVLAFFMVQGALYLMSSQPAAQTAAQLTPFMPFGVEGLLSTIGFVFVSYAGLTKVASVAEEVSNPDRNIPLGMMLSLGVTTFVYVAGVFIMVAVLDPSELRSDLTPVATAASAFFDWLPGRLGLMLIVIAALAAFASTGNAGLMSASRYPLAMARDRLLPAGLANLGRFQTPVSAILLSGGLMIVFIVVLDAEGIAKLASAFQLFIFMLVNLAVIVMRESRITSYDPGYKSPLYPWMQIFGILTSFVLIIYMGWLAILFTVVVAVLCLAWYHFYVRDRVQRDGAIYHWFKRLGARQHDALDVEFRSIMKEKGLRGEDPYEEIVSRSQVLDFVQPVSFDEVVNHAATLLAPRLGSTPEHVAKRFMEGTRLGATPVTHGVALPHFRTERVDQAELVLVRSHEPVEVPADDPFTPELEPDLPVRTLFFLVSPEAMPGQHLRILAQLAGRVDEESFQPDWFGAGDAGALRNVLLRNERSAVVHVHHDTSAAKWAGRSIRELDLPKGCLIVLIRRDGESIVPGGDTLVSTGDRLTVIGGAAEILELKRRFPVL